MTCSNVYQVLIYSTEAQSAIGVEVGDALVRYINEGNTVGAVNMPEVSLRSISNTDENRARVVFIHKNQPGVLRQVNSILGDHNVDKQMSDSRGDVAYLMADISNCSYNDLKGLYESLDSLSCKIYPFVIEYKFLLTSHTAKILTRVLY